jgi:predicted nucleic acid-binding protein
MRALVADSSVAIKWFAWETQSDLAEAMLGSEWRIHAPEFLWIETANGLWKKWRRKELSRIDVEQSVAKLRGVIDEWHTDRDLVEDAAELSLELGHPVYDCLFLALARKLEMPVITADTRLLSIAPNGLAIALTEWRP